MNKRFLNKLDIDFENGKIITEISSKFIDIVKHLILSTEDCYFSRIFHVLFLLICFKASKNSAALQEELESLFVSFSENIQLEVEQTKNEMNSKASAIEEVRLRLKLQLKCLSKES